MSRKTNFNKDRSGIEVADILRLHIGDYQKHYKLHPDHYKVVYDILNCRTAYLGGHLERCDCCGKERPAYNSCRNRHCPKCQTITKERWLEDRKAELLPVRYFHVVFTLPHELNGIVLCNKRVLLTILFRSVAETLLEFGRNRKNGLGGIIGFLAFLHTWDQQLNAHFHIHCLVPAGALAPDGLSWINCKYDFLFPQAALSKRFRKKFMDYLKKIKTKLKFPGKAEQYSTSSGYDDLVARVYSKQWVVKVEDPIDKPEYVLEYAGRYTHRVAISNDRILRLENGEVTFRFKNRDKGTTESQTITAVEFIRRFLLHVLPKGFMRIRHYGLFANRYKKENIEKCRRLLGYPNDLPDIVKKTVEKMMLQLTGIDITRCPFCGKGRMQKIMKIPNGSGESAFLVIRPHAIHATV
jgi:Putative transposase/Transposase zinc-binding domain